MKKLFALGFIFLFLNLAFASAYHTSRVTETWSYNEDLKGGKRGFTLSYNSNIPARHYPKQECEFYDWRYGSRCNPSYYNYPSYYYDEARSSRGSYKSFNEDKFVREAFRTYQQNSRNVNPYGYSRGYSSSYYGGYFYNRW
jgi:hypothetical protein